MNHQDIFFAYQRQHHFGLTFIARRRMQNSFIRNRLGTVARYTYMINNLRYADDTLILGANVQEMVAIMEKLTQTSRDYGLEINRAKTKVMVVDGKAHIQPHLREVSGFEVVEKYIYLGSLITNSGGCSEDIRRRTAIARDTTTKMSRTWKDRTIIKSTKLQLVNALIFPIATYATETWTMKQADRRKMESFELWVYRRILLVSWTEHLTKASILNELGIRTRLLGTIHQAYLRYFGQISRRTDTMENLVIEGRMNGSHPRGRSPTRWADRFQNLVWKSLPEAAHAAAERETWRDEVGGGGAT